jgi:uncharacterized protein
MDDKRKLPGLPTIFLLVTVLVGPELFAVISDLLFGKFPGIGLQVVLQIFYCGLAGFILWGVVKWEHQSLASIGFQRPGWSTLVSGVLVAIVGLFLPLITTPLTNALGSEGVKAGLQQLSAMPIWLRVCVGITGGAVEEILYRGYAIERLDQITGRRWLGALIALMVFTLAHIPAWGVAFALTADLLAGIVLTLFYLWKRDLFANTIAHSTLLVVGMLTMVP